VKRAGVVVAFVVGCGGGSSHDRVEKSDVYVLDKGKEPKQILRYDVPAGTKQALDLVVDMTMAAPAVGMKETRVPRMVMVIATEATSSDPSAGAALAMTISDARLEDRPGSMPVPGLGLDAMKGLRFLWRLAPDGVMHDFRFDAKSVPPEVRDQLGSTEQTMDQMAAILPDVPIGVGARWRVEETVWENDIKMQFETSYELTDLKDDVATTDAEMDISAPPQTIEKDGAQVRLDAMSGHEKATQILDLHGLASRASAQMTMDLSMSAQGQHVDMTEAMGMQMVPDGEPLAPPPPAPPSDDEQ